MGRRNLVGPKRSRTEEDGIHRRARGNDGKSFVNDLVYLIPLLSIYHSPARNWRFFSIFPHAHLWREVAPGGVKAEDRDWRVHSNGILSSLPYSGLE